MSDNIKVVVKVRPLISREIEDNLSCLWRVRNNALYQIDHNGKDAGQGFTFDKVYDKESQTADVYYDIAKPIVEAATRGINGTIFAYGQTSSGKTYTMMGEDGTPGITQMAVNDLFDIIKNIPDRDFLLRVSYIEIYNETLKDLLVPNKDKIKVFDTLQGIKVDATENVTSTPEEVFNLMRTGEDNRRIGATNMNEKSSRSHTIFQITIESREHTEGSEEAECVNVSQLNLVDLAGSERAGQTGATGIRFKEGTHINKSLSTLAHVITQLYESKSFVNYRDSKLTRILQNSLGGNAKTSIICAVTPASVDDTISTLQFANRAKNIKNKPEVNAVANNATMIQSLTKKLAKLQSQLESKKHVEQDNVTLNLKIGALQRQILNGYSQKSNSNSNRRKTWCAPQGPSTLLPIEEDLVPALITFRTPGFKYNVMASQLDKMQFTPIGSGLPTVMEETPRPITPTGKKDNNEIIELDSDDEIPAETLSCSPYHKCYGSSKTPPCVLRAKAEKAERNFEDIVELTGREKIYTPTIVELMEQLERGKAETERLEMEMQEMRNKGQEQEEAVGRLVDQLRERDHHIQGLTTANEQLRVQCQEYDIKLAESEFSFATLKKKANRIEEELMSLSQQQKVDINKNPENMMGKTENATAHIQQDLITDTQTQSKPENIEDYEFNNLKAKLNKLNDENFVLKSNIDTLTSIITGQNNNLDRANKDIESYNGLIQELQQKLSEKETKLNGDVIETLVTSEYDLICNNENIKNLIRDFKEFVHRKNKEVLNVQSTIETKFKKELEEYQELFASYQEDLANSKASIEMQSKEKIDIDKKLLDALENNKKLRNEINEKDEKLISISEKLETLEKLLQGSKKEYEDIKSYYEILKTSRDLEIQSLIKDFENKLTDAQENNTKLQIAQTERDDKIALLLQKQTEICHEIEISRSILEEKEKQYVAIKRNFELGTSDRDLEIQSLKIELQNKLTDAQENNAKLQIALTERDDKIALLLQKQTEICNEIKTSRSLLEEKESQYYAIKRDFELRLSDRDIEIQSLKRNLEKKLATAPENNLETCKNEKGNEIIKDIENYIGVLKNNQPTLQSDNLAISYEVSSAQLGTSPQSLIKICLNQVVDYIYNENFKNNSVTPSSSNSSINFKNSNIQVDLCECKNNANSFQLYKTENRNLRNTIDDLLCRNTAYIREREELQQEIKGLLELTNEMYKKVSNHRSSLSTLTATTFAENKLLKFQVKALEHHHNRFHNVYQRDVPEIKKQLLELLTILQNIPNSNNETNNSFKRYSLPNELHRNSTMSSFKNDSILTLGSDLLMLDTNITLNTTSDNTVIGQNQTCFDTTQDSAINDDLTLTVDVDNKSVSLDILVNDNKKMYQKLECLSSENLNLKEQIFKYTNLLAKVKDEKTLYQYPKIHSEISLHSKQTEDLKIAQDVKKNQTKVIEELKSNLKQLENSKEFETPPSEDVVCKLQHDCNDKAKEIIHLKESICHEMKKVKNLQDEIDNLSTELMDNISEVDILKKEVNNLKTINTGLVDKCKDLENIVSYKSANIEYVCSKCQQMSNEIIDSNFDRCIDNKFSSLRNELHASREDCKTITEEVATIKNHLEQRSLSMNQNIVFDDTLDETPIFKPTGNNFDHRGLDSKNSPNKTPVDLYTSDKYECFKYYIQKTGADKENFNENTEIVEVMKMLYDKLLSKHGNEIENLTNKLKDFEELKNTLQEKIDDMTVRYGKVCEELELNETKAKKFNEIIDCLKSNIDAINNIVNSCNSDSDTKLVDIYKRKFLNVLDEELLLSVSPIFDIIITNQTKEFIKINDKYEKLQKHVHCMMLESNNVNESLKQIKGQLVLKESEYNLLQIQKDNINEIVKAVTLDIVKKEEEFKDAVNMGVQKLIEHGVMTSKDIDLTVPAKQSVNVLLECLIKQNDQWKSEQHSDFELQRNDLILAVKSLKELLEEKDKQLVLLKMESEKILEINKAMTLDKIEKCNELLKHKCIQEEVSKKLDSKIKALNENTIEIEKLNNAICVLKETIFEKEEIIKNFENLIQKHEHSKHINEDEIKAMIKNVSDLEQENKNLQVAKEIIVKECTLSKIDLEKAGNLIKQKEEEIERMHSEVNNLNSSLKEKLLTLDGLTCNIHKLQEENDKLRKCSEITETFKKQYEKKNKECEQLQINIKTHEKTVEIQSNIIKRLEKQISDQAVVINEKEKTIEALSARLAALQSECEAISQDSRDLRHIKDGLETKVSELESRVEGMSGSGRRERRQSLYDSNRMFSEHHHKDADKMEVMDTESLSDRSTPTASSRRQDSSLVTRLDQSERERERERGSDTSRRRRQSAHDVLRATLTANTYERDVKSADCSGTNSTESEMAILRAQLQSYRQQLEELRGQYQELDEECETCAQYLRERDDQCIRLGKEKHKLESKVAELTEKLVNNAAVVPRSVSHAAVNTDEDWSNLHAVVVDRMSYDAEVDRNRQLTRALEEFRQRNRELRPLAKELELVRDRLRERELQCGRLGQAKAVLEAKLLELQEAGGKMVTAKKKRHSVHDQHREHNSGLIHTATNTEGTWNDRKCSATDDPNIREILSLRTKVEALTREKTALEASHTMVVGTGSAIVQNQQLSDIMRENQKLKKSNAKLMHYCKKWNKASEANRENEEPTNLG